MELINIRITTKNRWKDLENTLGRVAAFGLGETRIVICDDGSDRPCPFEIACICRRAELKRYATSAGYIVRRNQLARAMNSRYYLRLDDDSFAVSGSLDAAIEFAESRADTFRLSFPIYNPNLGKSQLRSLRDDPYEVRSFVGCAHLLHRKRFLTLNGYREELMHFSEELEIAARFPAGLAMPSLSQFDVLSYGFQYVPRLVSYGLDSLVVCSGAYIAQVGRILPMAEKRWSGRVAGKRTAALRRIARKVGSCGLFYRLTCRTTITPPLLCKRRGSSNATSAR